MKIRIRDTEACEPQPSLYWDSQFQNRLDASGGWADWVLAGPDAEPASRGGLRAGGMLHTAVIICLFTDARLPEEDIPPDESPDRRGWWGDSVQGEDEPGVPMGSLLWTLERSTISEETARLAEQYAADALQVLIDQGAVAAVETEAEIVGNRDQLRLRVRLYSHSRTLVYDQKFDVLWRQTQNLPPMHTLSAR